MIMIIIIIISSCNKLTIFLTDLIFSKNTFFYSLLHYFKGEVKLVNFYGSYFKECLNDLVN